MIGVYPRPERGDGVFQIAYVDRHGVQATKEITGATAEEAAQEAAELNYELLGDLEAPPPPRESGEQSDPDQQEAADIILYYMRKIRSGEADSKDLREARVVSQLGGSLSKHLDWRGMDRRLGDIEKRDAARDAARKVGQDAEPIEGSAPREARATSN